MTDNGEPWVRDCHTIRTRDGFLVAEFKVERDAKRVLECVNALDEIDDVEAWVEEAKGLMIVKDLAQRHFVKKNEEAHDENETAG